jgi:hypothetical protein
MDLLDFEAEQLYFDEPIDAEAQNAIATAAEYYGEKQAEDLLMRAYFLEPEHPSVLVALYRYFYYQHRLSDALRVAERVLRVFARRLGLPLDWRELNPASFNCGLTSAMTQLRFTCWHSRVRATWNCASVITARRWYGCKRLSSWMITIGAVRRH